MIYYCLFFLFVLATSLDRKELKKLQTIFTPILFGILVLFLGLQLRAIESYVIKEEAARWWLKNVKKEASFVSAATTEVALNAPEPVTRSKRTITPPRWIAWVLISFGGVVILHSMALAKP